MTEQTSISCIPDDAVEFITTTWLNGNKQRSLYLLDGKEIGWRWWYPSGVLGMEGELRDGIAHGSYRVWHENGRISQESTYYEGKEHGETRQYDENGLQIGSYILEYG